MTCLSERCPSCTDLFDPATLALAQRIAQHYHLRQPRDQGELVCVRCWLGLLAIPFTR